MKNAIKILGGLLVVIGLVWILQGFNILPGSFMTGDKFWAGMGAIAAAVGVLLLFLRIGRPKA
jgi:hypothetical protein